MNPANALNTDGINDALKDLYRRKLSQPVFDKLTGFAVPKTRDISYPLFGHVKDGYLHSAIRLMFVGQQTHHWCGKLNRGLQVEDILGASYVGYEQALERKGKPYTTSPFWRAVQEVYARCNPSMDPKTPGFFWTNLWKVDDNAGPPQVDLREFLLEGFCALREEIEILRPHAVIFFTGPYHDPRRILRDLADLKPLSVAEPVSSASPLADGPLFIHTYHPNFLRRKGRGYWDGTLDTIAELARGSRLEKGAVSS